MPKEISNERKAAYYIGMALQVVGGILFASAFVTFLIRFGDFTDFDVRARSEGLRALGGMALLIIGAVVRTVGARGLAGSGVLLDPARARGELEPYSRMAGGIVKDAADEAGLNLSGEPRQVVAIKCQSCGSLNGQDAKYCQQCGQAL